MTAGFERLDLAVCHRPGLTGSARVERGDRGARACSELATRLQLVRTAGQVETVQSPLGM